VRRQGVGSVLFRKLIAEARSNGYHFLRITTGATEQAMRALASKFGAHLTFRHGESTGSIDLRQHPQPELARYRSQRRPKPHARSLLQPRVLEACFCECTAGAGRPDRRRLHTAIH